MSKRSRKSRERREANRRLPLSGNSFSRSYSPNTQRTRPVTGVPTSWARSRSYEPSRRLQTDLKNRSRPREEQYSPGTKTQTPSKPYRQPNWAAVSPERTGTVREKKIEQPTICERREARKQVLFATKKTGRSGQKTPVWTLESRLTCRKK